MRKINKIVLHCTDSPDDLDIGFHNINQWHKERGFISPSGIHCGYHYIVRRNGASERGRPDSEAGAHCKGHNSSSLGVVWVGRTKPSDSQMKSLHVLVRGLMHQYQVDVDQVLGHTELDPQKTCPNIDMNLFRANLLFKEIK